MPTVSAQTLEREFSPSLQKALRRHAGKWVATTATKLLAVGDSPSEVYREAKRKGAKAPMVYRVPEGKRAYFF